MVEVPSSARGKPELTITEIVTKDGKVKSEIKNEKNGEISISESGKVTLTEIIKTGDKPQDKLVITTINTGVQTQQMQN